MKPILVTISALGVALAVACGGGSDSTDGVLHLRGFDATEEQYRALVESEASAFKCQFLKGLDAKEVAALVDALSNQELSPETRAWAEQNNWTPKPSQARDRKSSERAAQLEIDACKPFTS